MADHLGQLYERKNLHAQAIRMWQLALAADKTNEEARRHLQTAGLPESGLLMVQEKGSKFPVVAGEELGRLRNIKLSALPKQDASTELFLLQTKQGVEDVKFISGQTPVKDAASAIRAAKSAFEFPDAGPEKIFRRAILYCSTYTDPSCSLTLLLPSATKLESIVEKADKNSAIESANR